MYCTSNSHKLKGAHENTQAFEFGADQACRDLRTYFRTCPHDVTVRPTPVPMRHEGVCDASAGAWEEAGLGAASPEAELNKRASHNAEASTQRLLKIASCTPQSPRVATRQAHTDVAGTHVRHRDEARRTAQSSSHPFRTTMSVYVITALNRGISVSCFADRAGRRSV